MDTDLPARRDMWAMLPLLLFGLPHDGMGHSRGWRTLLAVSVAMLAALLLARISRPPDEADRSREAGTAARAGSWRRALLLCGLSLVITVAIILCGSLVGWLSSGRRNTFGWVLSGCLSGVVFVPPIVTAVGVLGAGLAGMSRKGDRRRSPASWMGYAGLLGAPLGALLYLIDQLSVPGAGDYMLFGPFLLWPSVFIYVLDCTLVTALAGYLAWSLAERRRAPH